MRALCYVRERKLTTWPSRFYSRLVAGTKDQCHVVHDEDVLSVANRGFGFQYARPGDGRGGGTEGAVCSTASK
jgi:hypothetical protein